MTATMFFPKEQPGTGRVVLIGGGGFIGRAIADSLSSAGVESRTYGSSDMDLTAGDAAARLAKLIAPADRVVFLSAVTPSRDRGVDAFMRNNLIGRAAAEAFEAVKPAHVVYFSSDAVYAFDGQPINETTRPSPPELYGVTHYAREQMMRSAVGDHRLAIVRPTMVYGPGDPHNSYGPMRFIRECRDDGAIRLFGQGEETRDYIYYRDVAEIVSRILSDGLTGTLNLAGGQSVRFRDLASIVTQLVSMDDNVVTQERRVPITHRTFDIRKIHATFPDLRITPLRVGLKECIAAESRGQDA